MFMTSQSEKSMCSPWPLARARVARRRGRPRPLKVPPIHSVVCPPHMTGGIALQAATREAAPLFAWTTRSAEGVGR